jgi:hypothetical protein
VDLVDDEPAIAETARATLAAWTAEQLDRSHAPRDPMQTVLDEGGPFHIRGHLPAYLARLRATGRERWIEPILTRHPDDAART